MKKLPSSAAFLSQFWLEKQNNMQKHEAPEQIVAALHSKHLLKADKQKCLLF